MDAIRARLSFESDHIDRVQWAGVAAVVAVGIVLAALLVRELRSAPSFDAIADAASVSVVPREAVSVPAFVLAAGHQVRVGEARAEAIAQLAPLKLLKRADEEGPLGSREVRSYQGVTLVFEPFERAGDSRVAAIYLQ